MANTAVEIDPAPKVKQIILTREIDDLSRDFTVTFNPREWTIQELLAIPRAIRMERRRLLNQTIRDEKGETDE